MGSGGRRSSYASVVVALALATVPAMVRAAEGSTLAGRVPAASVVAALPPASRAVSPDPGVAAMTAPQGETCEPIRRRFTESDYKNSATVLVNLPAP
jgi:hypothetical protein